jgi:hypothetical protein
MPKLVLCSPRTRNSIRPLDFATLPLIQFQARTLQTDSIFDLTTWTLEKRSEWCRVSAPMRRGEGEMSAPMRERRRKGQPMHVSKTPTVEQVRWADVNNRRLTGSRWLSWVVNYGIRWVIERRANINIQKKILNLRGKEWDRVLM